MPRSLRDLLPAIPPADPTMQDLVASNPPVDHGVTDIERRLGSRMPGDDIGDHPLALHNPYKGMNPQKLRRMLVDGEITDSFQRQQAAEWLRAYEILTGEVVIKSCTER